MERNSTVRSVMRSRSSMTAPGVRKYAPMGIMDFPRVAIASAGGSSRRARCGGDATLREGRDDASGSGGAVEIDAMGGGRRGEGGSDRAGEAFGREGVGRDDGKQPVAWRGCRSEGAARSRSAFRRAPRRRERRCAGYPWWCCSRPARSTARQLQAGSRNRRESARRWCSRGHALRSGRSRRRGGSGR